MKAVKREKFLSVASYVGVILVSLGVLGFCLSTLVMTRLEVEDFVRTDDSRSGAIEELHLLIESERKTLEQEEQWGELGFEQCRVLTERAHMACRNVFRKVHEGHVLLEEGFLELEEVFEAYKVDCASVLQFDESSEISRSADDKETAE